MPPDEAPLDSFLDPEAEEKRRAVLDPGPKWGDWFLFSGAKPWVGLGFLIIDVWVVGSWLSPLNLAGLVLSLPPAIYLEFLAYRYLWYRPDEILGGHRFRPSWHALREVGVWTPEERLLRSGTVPRAPQGPDPREFL